MKPSSPRNTPVAALLERALRSLQGLLGRWAPQPPPVLVPIPIRAERHPRIAAGRHGRRGV